MDSSPPISRLVMVGACYVDTILSVPKFPSEDHKLRATNLFRRRGGNVANSLEVLQQFPSITDNVDLNLLCILPSKSSPGAEFVRNSLGAEVKMDCCIYREAHSEPASSYILKSEASGSRTIVNYNELPEMTLSEFKEKISRLAEGERRTWFHFEGREVKTSIQCSQWLKSEYPDCVRSVEVEKPNRPELERMAQEADVVFFSKTWAEAAGFSDAETLLREQAKMLRGATLLCCTWGAQGAAVFSPVDGSLHTARSAPEIDAQVVDTIGAGDTFTAGMIQQFMKPESGAMGDRAKAAVEFANELAGRKVLQEGFSNLGSG